ncbi:hypothetical protein VOLCADRAFT_102592 [Volvox carteri f. nagariensis]|uniref:Translin-associated factor X-interacting protein 1 N-terminal domain-containing protein n=1 Tax=Volvox carteri f. nagariensis TaxID=3068 RepID=D8TGW8_VOLCA|nr:uncharacterized protein VOLCADRAFT_102592 [Volvox carteri f. nagariensis]EFJ52972.1 hypothetical protein VOLCADRAFT_102592 [Volvox carteri f. nagariensis]|eukprot:XP_002945977.1 hypothetical protein VOLCADRAFT_102592 [Volvox carteri f. nagariensis]
MAPFGGGGSRSGKEADLAAAVAAAQTASFDVRGWSRQAKEITSDLTGSDKYKSLALHAEVKLAEALERCERVSPVTRSSSGEERPNKLRTAVACQLLGEFAELCGPFSGVLITLRDELLKAVYSWHYASERGGLSFDQLPWFAVSERLERDKEAMLEEREAFKQQLQEQQEAVARIEDQMNALRRATEVAQLDAATLRSHLDRVMVSEESARLEAKTGREELKKLRKEYLKMKDELEAERDAHTKLQERHVELKEFSAARIAELSAALAAAEVDAVDARRLAESRMPPEVYEKLQATLADTQSELELAQSHIRDVEAVNSKLAHRLDVMTPRPVWRKIAEHNIQPGRRTAELVHRVEEKLGRYANELEELKARLNLAAALLQPDAAPTEVQLSLITEDLNYFLTEGAGSTTGPTSNGPAVAEPCGLAPTVPRCLRWPQRVTLQTLSQEQTEAIAMAMWKARQAMDVSSSSGTLQSFVYYYFNPQGMATADTARMCYSFYYACSTYAKSSAVVRTFWLVMTGQVSEAAAIDQRIMVSGLTALLHSLPAVNAAAGDLLAAERILHIEDVSSALERLFPNRPSFRISKLRDALRTQFGGAETVRLEALQAVLDSHGLHAPPASTASSTAKATRFRQELIGSGSKGGATSGGSHPVGPFISVLLAQHIDEIQTLCMEVATQLADTPAVVDATDGEHGDNPAEVVAVVEKLGALLGPSRAAACVLAALGFSTGDGSGSGRRNSAEGEDVSGSSGDDIVMPMGAIVDLTDMTAWVLRRCLIKPVGSYDISGAMQWAREALDDAGS